MRTVGAFEAKTHLSSLLEVVAKGETSTITKHGTPAAQLVPPPGARQADVGAAIEALRRYRREQNISLGGLTIREMIDDRGRAKGDADDAYGSILPTRVVK